MIILEILQTLLNAQAAAANVSDCAATVNQNGDLLSMCPASAFTAVAAALSTEGYYMQSDVLFYLRFGTYNAWAPLLYVCAAIGGMMSMVLGGPPKNYMWFFIGPALYAWLIDTTQYVQGVSWRVAGRQQDQSEVWRLSEVGLRNSGAVTRYNADFVGPPEPGQTGGATIYNNKPVSYTHLTLPTNREV